MASNPRPDVVASSAATAAAKAAVGSDQQVETVRCACCGVGEDCTAAYIRGVRASFCSDWLCGLCAEAVKERVRRQEQDPAGGGGVAAALGAHEAECQEPGPKDGVVPGAEEQPRREQRRGGAEERRARCGRCSARPTSYARRCARSSRSCRCRLRGREPRRRREIAGQTAGRRCQCGCTVRKGQNRSTSAGNRGKGRWGVN